MSSRVAVALLSLVVCATACTDAVARKHPALPTAYGGSTSDDSPFGLQLSKDHRHLVRALVHARADCPSGGHSYVSGEIPFVAKLPKVVTANTFKGNRLPASGSFSAHGLGVQDFGSRTGLLAEDISGNVKGRNASGTYKATVTMVDPASGQTIETCSSETVRWHAKASPRHVYIGLTASRLPVVVALSTDRLRVADMWFAWIAPCEPSGTFVIGDHLSNFPIAAGGSFGDAFDAGPFNNSDGTAASFHYDIHGAVARTSASGTVAATFTQTDASGATMATCALAGERWKAFG